MLCHLLGLPSAQYWRFHLEPCALTQVNVYESGGILMRLNDDRHLRERP
jgi:broad specificity phosphatase PhoE